MTKPQNDLCSQRRLRSARVSAQSDQSSLCAQWVALDPRFLHADSEDSSDWADAQADLSLHWGHRGFCWFVVQGLKYNVFGVIEFCICVFVSLNLLNTLVQTTKILNKALHLILFPNLFNTILHEWSCKSLCYTGKSHNTWFEDSFYI